MAITSIGTAQRSSTATTVTLNCAAGGNWTTTPATGDLMVVFAYYDDDSTLAQFTPPAGWTLIQSNIFVTSILAFQIHYRFATASEATYTWTAVANGQTGQCMLLHGFTLRGAANPLAFDPVVFRKLNQADAVTQPNVAAIVVNADSALFGGWGQDVATVNYSALSTVNGVTPTALFDAPSTTNSHMRCASGLWLAPGAGSWTTTATEGGPVAASWGATKFGIRAAGLGNPQRTLVGIGT